MRMSDDGLTAQEVADRLGTTEKTVRRWIDAGRLEAAKVGNAYSIRLSDAEAVFRVSRAGRGAAASSTLEQRVDELRQEVAHWQARYHEVREREERLESLLREQQLLTARLEVRVDLPAAA
jgi:excisionase family DNA binding protein